eukprot:scaffold9726_cov119-Isochrysis_galbana.AAC.12
MPSASCTLAHVWSRASKTLTSCNPDPRARSCSSRGAVAASHSALRCANPPAFVSTASCGSASGVPSSQPHPTSGAAPALSASSGGYSGYAHPAHTCREPWRWTLRCSGSMRWTSSGATPALRSIFHCSMERGAPTRTAHGVPTRCAPCSACMMSGPTSLVGSS